MVGSIQMLSFSVMKGAFSASTQMKRASRCLCASMLRCSVRILPCLRRGGESERVRRRATERAAAREREGAPVRLAREEADNACGRLGVGEELLLVADNCHPSVPIPLPLHLLLRLALHLLDAAPANVCQLVLLLASESGISRARERESADDGAAAP